MSNKIPNLVKNNIKEYYPELYSMYNGLKVIAQAIESVVKPYVIQLQKIVETPEFKAFITKLNLIHTLYKVEDKFWIIEDGELLNILSTLKEDEYSNQITEYYSRNNYEKISDFITEWEKTNSINERLPIIIDCFEAMRTISNKKLINNIIIPTLLAQITGVTESLHSLVPKEKRDELKKELTKNGNTPSDGEITTEYLWHQEHKREVFECYKVIFEAVMKNTKKIENFTEEDLEKYNKYRNKILHGDVQFLNYGTDENLIRTWLELNIVIKVYSIYKDYKPRVFDNERI